MSGKWVRQRPVVGAAIAARYEDGATWAELAGEFHLSHQTMIRLLREIGIKLSRRTQWTTVPTDEVSEVIVARYESGEDWRTLAVEFGFTRKTIYQLLREAGKKPRRSKQPLKPLLPVDDAARMYNEGHSIREIAERLNASYGAVHHALTTHPDVEVRPPGHPSKNPLASEANRLYSKGHSVREIANMLDRSLSTIYRLIDSDS